MSKKKKRNASQKQPAPTSPREASPTPVPPPEAPEAPLPRDPALPLPGARAVALTLGAILAFIVAMIGVWYLKDIGAGGRFLATWSVGSMTLFAAVVIFGAASVLHPAYGLAVLTIYRPWLDGMTYPGDNFYFLGGILVLTVLWALRTLLRGGGVRHLLPAGLLFAYIVLALVLLPSSYQADTTINQALLWGGYLVLFLLVSNAMRERGAAHVVLGGFVVAAVYQAIYAIIHFEFMLDYVRQLMKENPEALKQFFPVETITPEVIRRLNINRAFGTMLHPNTLAAFMILAVPSAMGGLIYCVRRSGEAARAWLERGARHERVWPLTIPTAALTWVTIFLATQLYGNLTPTPPADTTLFAIALIAATSLAVAFPGLLFVHARKNGFLAAAYAAGAFGCLAAIPTLAYALWLSYSRGAMLALLFAFFLVGLVLLARRRFGAHAARAAAIVLLAGAAGVLGIAADGDTPNTAPVAPGTTEDPQRASRELAVEGVDLTTEELLDPSSFRIRLTYWRVALRMALDNPWTGVGLGNFGVAYPKYQDMEAGDVQTAHNALLKAFAETGIPGLVLFCLFWLVALLTGLRAIWREADPAKRWMNAGFFTGVLAFLGHALLDFHFVHPSLMFFLMVVLGLLYTGVPVRGPAGLGRQVAMIALLVGAALMAGVAFRIYSQHYQFSGSRINVAGEERLKHNRMLIEEVFPRVTDYAQARQRAIAESTTLTMPAPRLPFDAIKSFLEPAIAEAGYAGNARELLERMGSFAVETPERTLRPLAEEAPLPERGVWYVIDRRPFIFNELMMEAAQQWLDQVAAIDRLFPYRPDIAAYIGELYQALLPYAPAEKFPGIEDRLESQWLHWTAEAVERSPQRYEFRTRYAQALWYQAEQRPLDERRSALEDALGEYRAAQRLAANIVPLANFNLAGALRRYGNSLIAAGEAQRGAQLLEEASAFQEQGERIYRVRGRLGFI